MERVKVPSLLDFIKHPISSSGKLSQDIRDFYKNLVILLKAKSRTELRFSAGVNNI